MDGLTIISFLGAAIGLTIMPGPDNLFVLAQSIAQGKKAGIATTLGLCTGLLVHISAAALGVSAVIYQSAFAFHLVKYMGAAYLLWLAFQAFRQKQSKLTIEHQESMDYRALYRRGIMMNMLNPKVSLFFLALLPQFITTANGYIPLQMIGLGVIFLIQALVIFSLISIFADQARALLIRYPAVARRLNFVEGALLSFIGISIAISGK